MDTTPQPQPHKYNLRPRRHTVVPKSNVTEEMHKSASEKLPSDSEDECYQSESDCDIDEESSWLVDDEDDDDDMDEDEDEDEGEGDSEIDEDEEEDTPANLGYRFRTLSKILGPIVMMNTKRDLSNEFEMEEEETPNAKQNKLELKKYKPLLAKFSNEEKDYFMQLSDEARFEYATKYHQVMEIAHNQTPLKFRILSSTIPEPTKRLLLSKLEGFAKMNEGSGEYHKMSQWFQSVAKLPLGKFVPLPVNDRSSMEDVSKLLIDAQRIMDETVFGHQDAKDQMLRILAQWVSNPQSKGNVIGIQGPMGIGKTTLIKEAVSRALYLPFAFIALGGAADGAFLEGHGYTYEGSTYGKIAEVLMRTECMNPIIFFDELDKVSDTSKGEEIYNILTHLTDATQNEQYTDRYFGSIELDLSKALFVFSYNDESKIHPILKDRFISIRVKGYDATEKINIAQKYLVPCLLEQFGLATTDIEFPTDILQQLIQRVPQEKGVRHLKRGMESILGWINMSRYIPRGDDPKISLPHKVNEGDLRRYVKMSSEEGAMNDYVAHSMYL